MPSAAVTRIRARIGDMGLPSVVWLVEVAYFDGGKELHGFYDRDKAQAYADEAPNRTVIHVPLKVMDASPR